MRALCRVFLSVPPSLTLLSVNPGYQAATPAVHTSGPACYRPQDQFYPQAREPTHFSRRISHLRCFTVSHQPCISLKAKAQAGRLEPNAIGAPSKWLCGPSLFVVLFLSEGTGSRPCKSECKNSKAERPRKSLLSEEPLGPKAILGIETRSPSASSKTCPLQPPLAPVPLAWLHPSVFAGTCSLLPSASGACVWGQPASNHPLPWAHLQESKGQMKTN